MPPRPASRKTKKQTLPRFLAGCARRALDILGALLIRRDTPGPIYYRGPRTGKDGVSFQILKFRTMYKQPESYAGPKVTAENDPRITPIGRWLRDTKLNELPQLWNVLKGEMSLVGPRPEDPGIVTDWPEAVRRELLAVRPGITSPASIVYKNEEKLLVGENLMGVYFQGILPSKLRLDTLYLRNRTLLSDLDVLFWTLVTLLPRIKKAPIPEYRLYFGPFSSFIQRIFNWFFIDMVVSFAGFAFVGFVWRATQPLDIGWGVALVFSLGNVLRGLDKVYWSRAHPKAVDLAVMSVFSTLVLYFLNVGLRGSLLHPAMVRAGMNLVWCFP